MLLIPPKSACELTDATPMVLNAKSAADATKSAHLFRNIFEEKLLVLVLKDDASFSSIGARSKRPRSSFARVPNRESMVIHDRERERERECVVCGDFFCGENVV